MTAWLQTKNNAGSVLAEALTAVAASLAVKTGEGDRFPSVFPFHITVDNEIMECTNRVGDVLTVTRAQESTAAATHASNAAVRLNITAAIISQLQSESDLRIPKSVLDAKGDILVGSADNTPARLAPGTNGQILRARPAEALGLKWEDFPVASAYLSSGSYTGNNTANRAIPHGLGSIPKIIFIVNTTDTSVIYNAKIYGGFGWVFAERLAGGYCYTGNPTSDLAVTAPDSTNFYVGNSADYPDTMNATGKNYNWTTLC